MKGHKVTDDENIICTANGSLEDQENNSSTTEWELWRNTAPGAFQFQENMSKSDKIWCEYLVLNCVGLRTFWTPFVCGHLRRFRPITFAHGSQWHVL